jgi:hypothetical protein
MGPDPDPDHPVAGMHIWGWMSPAELTWLYETAKGMDSVAEIGSLHGRSGWALAQACPGTVYLIDPWDDWGSHGWKSIKRTMTPVKNVSLFRGFSVDAAKVLPDVDMCFIDGAHDEGNVRQDIEAWLPKTRKVLCGPDYINEDGGYPDVAKVVNEIFGSRVVVAPENEWGTTSIWTVDLT